VTVEDSCLDRLLPEPKKPSAEIRGRVKALSAKQLIEQSGKPNMLEGRELVLRNNSTGGAG
jgi:hypothetical protein